MLEAGDRERTVILSGDGALDTPLPELREMFATPELTGVSTMHGDVARVVKETLEILKMTRPKTEPQGEAKEKQR